MSKKFLTIAGVVVLALVAGITSMVFFAKVQPTEAEVRASVAAALPDGATIDQLTFAVFSDDRSQGRVSVKGTYSFDLDIFSLPTPPVKLLNELSSAQIFDRDIARWWAENSSFYPQFKGQLGEFRKIYSSGEILDFAGELPYLAVVDGTRVDSRSLDFKSLDGTNEPGFGYVDDSANVSELTAAIVEWRDRRRDEAAAAEAARAAEAEAAAQAAARAAAVRAEEEAIAAEVEAAAAVRAAAAQAAAEAAAQAERDRVEAIRTDAQAVPCQRLYTEELNCMTVTFGYKTKYDREGIPGHCIMAMGGSVTWTDLGGGQYRAIGADGSVTQFFDFPGGVERDGLECH